MKWLECVPNFSEGRNQGVIDAIGAAIDSVPGVVLLHTDAGADANRTVYTFAGLPEDVIEAAYRGIMKAAELIDMRIHTGAHPRLGACDVCPLIPMGDMTAEEALPYAEALGRRLGESGIPIYLYEHSATHPDRKNLANIRKGEYEDLESKLKAPGWLPDFGPWTFQEKFGAMVLGVRDFLVAYNINLSTLDVGIAGRMAAKLRESGTKMKGGMRAPGLFRGLKAIGWLMESYGCAQVSTNITDIRTLSVKNIYDAAQRLAKAEGVEVTGSELIGMIPERVLLEAGKAILFNENDKETLIRAAISYLGMDIDPEERILESAIFKKTGISLS